MRLAGQQCVAVAHRASVCVIANDAQRVAQRGADVDRGGAAGQQGCGRDLLPMDGQLADAIGRGDGEAAGVDLRLVGVRGWIHQLARAQWQALLVDHGVATVGLGCQTTNLRCRVPDRDGQRGVRQVPVAILDGVGEGVGRSTCRARVAGVAVGAIGGQRQLAVGAVDLHAHRGCIVQVGAGVARGHSHHAAGAHSLAVCAERVIAQHIAAHRAEQACAHIVGVQHRRGHVVHDLDRQSGRVGLVVTVRQRYRECVKQVVVAITSRMLLVVNQRVGVADFACGGVIALDFQCVAQRRYERTSGEHAIRDERLAVDLQRFDAIRRADGECSVCSDTTATRTCRFAISAAGQQGQLRHGGVATVCLGCQPTNLGGRVANRDGQCGVRQVTVAILDGVGEGVGRATCRAGVAGVAVGAIGGQCQLAVGAVDLHPHCGRVARSCIVQVGAGVARGHPHHAAGAQGLAVCTERVIAQHIAFHGTELTSRDAVAVYLRRGHIVYDRDHDASACRAACAACHCDFYRVLQGVVACPRCMRLCRIQCVFVADRACLVVSPRGVSRDSKSSFTRIHGW